MSGCQADFSLLIIESVRRELCDELLFALGVYECKLPTCYLLSELSSADWRATICSQDSRAQIGDLLSALRAPERKLPPSYILKWLRINFNAPILLTNRRLNIFYLQAVKFLIH